MKMLRKPSVLLAAFILLSTALSVGAAALDCRAAVAAENISVTELTDEGSAVVAALSAGDELRVTGYAGNGWFAVSAGDESDGFARAESVTLSGACGKAAGNGVIMREEPSTASGIVQILAENTEVAVTGVWKQWYIAEYNGSEGYIRCDLLVPDGSAIGFGDTNGSGIRIRSGPGVTYPIVSSLPRGTAVEITGICKDWYQINCGELSGYIRNDLISLAGNAAESASSLGGQVAELALSFIGTDYVYGCASPSSGFDCSGLVSYVYKQFGYSLNRSARTMWQNGSEITKGELQTGDVVFFSSKNTTASAHAGIYIGNGEFVHASSAADSVIVTSLSSGYYVKHWYGAKRILTA